MAVCYYNFIRPHRSLRFGRDVWTPAMMAEVANRELTFRSPFLVAATIEHAAFVLRWSFSENVDQMRLAA
jgi:hypothetical protein